jgi:hypothetical protein
MSFSEETGYTPKTFNNLMSEIRQGVNAQFGTSYTADSFVGTNFYKYFYALMQKLQESEVRTSEVFLKLQEYISVTNERISRPVVTPMGIIDKLESEGFTASVKPPIDADAGKLFVCIDLDDEADDYEAEKTRACNILKDSVVGGIVTQGSEVKSLVLSNGQSFDYKFNLPDRIEPLLRLTVTLSENNQVLIKSPEEVRATLIANIKERYRLGKNFEPQRYFSVNDAPWASKVLLEYSLNSGSSYQSVIYNCNYDELFEIKLENVAIVEA